MASGFFGRHLLDLDAALGGEHAEVQLGGTVEGEGGVVLLGDVAGHSIQTTLTTWPLMSIPRIACACSRASAELAASLIPPALPRPHLHLGLDHDRIADAVGDLDGFLDGRRRCARGHRDAVAREELLALIFEQVHSGSRVVRREMVVDPARPHKLWLPTGLCPHAGRTPWSVPAERSDKQVLVLATGAVIVAGLMVAAVLLFATEPRRRARRSTCPSRGLATASINRAARRGPLLLPGSLRQGPQHPVRARTREDRGPFVHSARHQELRSEMAWFDQPLRRLPRRPPREHRPQPLRSGDPAERLEQGVTPGRPPEAVPRTGLSCGIAPASGVRSRSAPAAPTRAGGASRRRRGS